MADRLPAFLDIARYGITPDDLVRAYLGCSPGDICRRVIMLADWKADLFDQHADAIATVCDGPLRTVCRLEYRGEAVSLIRSGIGAALAGDVVLALGATPCEELLFTGSAGGLLPSMEIGDLVVAERSVCAEGFSRYLEPEVRPRDCFLDSIAPDAALSARLASVAQEASREHAVPLHSGSIVCVESILGEFLRLDYFAEQCGCIGVEMETSPLFKAAALVGIRAAALLQISDVMPTGKTLFSGRTEEEMSHRAHIKADILPQILLETLASGRQ